MKFYLVNTMQATFSCRSSTVCITPDADNLAVEEPKGMGDKSFYKVLKTALEPSVPSVPPSFIAKFSVNAIAPGTRLPKVEFTGQLLNTLKKAHSGNWKLKVSVQNLKLQIYSDQEDSFVDTIFSWAFESEEIAPNNPCEGLLYCTPDSPRPLDVFLTRWDQSQSERRQVRFVGGVTVEACRKSNYEGIVLRDFRVTKKILSDELSTDVKIICEGGAIIKAHKCFLAAHSPVFDAMFKSDLKTDSNRDTLEIPEMTETGVKALLAYIYYWDIKDAEESVDVALELLKSAHVYHIENLEEAMKALLLDCPNEAYTADLALELFLFAKEVEGGDELKMKSIYVMKTCYEELQGSEAFETLFGKDPKVAKELCASIVMAWRNETE